MLRQPVLAVAGALAFLSALHPLPNEPAGSRARWAAAWGALRRVIGWACGVRPRGVHADLEESRMDLTGAIVVGCDGDRDSHGALRFAVQEAALRAAPLVIVATYLHPIDPDVDDFDTPEKVLAHRAVTAARGALRQALGASESELPPHEVVTASGPASHVLITKFKQAQILVVGTHQRHLVSRLLHGPSTSTNLIHHARTPVVVVPPDWQPTHSGSRRG